MEFNKADTTTYINGILLGLFSYLGISQATANTYLQILTPIISIIIAYGMSYINEKYPSNLVTDPTEGLIEDTGAIDGI